MKTFAVVTLVVLSGVAVADGPPRPPSPQKEHEWLQQLVGEWQTETEADMGPGQPPLKCKGTESVRSLGGYWTHGEVKGDVNGMPVTGIMTLGYDPQAKKYVGTWVCSM